MPLTVGQLQQRQKGIGASEIAALIGVNRYAGPMDVYLSKVQPWTEGRQVNDHMRRGIHLEPGIIGWYADVMRCRVQMCDTMVHPNHPIVMATPDGIVHSEHAPPRVLEVKCPSWRASLDWGEPGTDEVPEYYWPQLQWQMGVTGLKRAHMVGFFNDELNVYPVDFVPEIFAGLVRVATTFWEEHVVKGIPPEVDDSQGSTEYLTSMHPRERKPIIESNPIIDGAMVDWRDSVAQIRAHQVLIDKARNTIREALGEVEGAQGVVGKVTWKRAKDVQVVDYPTLVRDCGILTETIQKYTRIREGTRVMRARFK